MKKNKKVIRTRLKFTGGKYPQYYIFYKRRNWLQKLALKWLTGCEVEDFEA